MAPEQSICRVATGCLQRTMQSTAFDLELPLDAGADGEENAGGGVNFMPGLEGRTIGGFWMLGVKPNWPAAKF